MTRYARQVALPQIGREGQARLARAHVLVVGAGGLAATALPLLAGAGIGRLDIVDHDVVELSNLHRQHFFREQDCGEPKAMIAAQRCRDLNSECNAHAHCTRLTPASAGALIEGADIVLDCADSYAVSYTLSDFCRDQCRPLISASALGFSGYVGGFCGSKPSLRAVFPDAPQSAATCASAGVTGPLVSILGALQAQMTLNHLAGITPSPLGQMIQIDVQNFTQSIFRFDEAPEPDAQFPFVSKQELSDQDVIIDLRDASEAPVLLHPSARRVAPDAIAELPREPARLALCCASGLRAWRAAETLSTQWPGQIVLVAESAT